MAKKARFTRPEDAVHQRITRSYLFALALIALTATSAFLSQRLSAAIDEGGDRVTRLLERQAATSQRLALHAQQWALAVEPSEQAARRDKFATTLARLRETHQLLREGGELAGVAVPRSRTLQRVLATPEYEIGALLESALARGDAMLAADPQALTAVEVAPLIALADDALYAQLSTIGEEFRRQQGRQVLLVEIIAGLVYLLTLVGLALEARYVFAPIAQETTDRTRQFAHARIEVSRLMQQVHEGREALDQVRDELRRRALHDELTGLANRRCLMEFGARAIANAQRGDRVVALVYLALGRLDVVNETLGYAAGDAVLQEAADILSTECRAADFPARAGGDKLLLMVSDVQGAHEVEQLADRLIERFSSPIVIDGQVVHIEVNIGIAQSDEVGGEFSRLLAKAGQALDLAKRAGAGRWHRYQTEGPPVPAVRDGRFDPLRAALAHDTVKTWYMPVLRDGEVEAMDLRMSWQTPDGEVHGAHEIAPIEGYTTMADHLLERSIVAGSRALARWRAAGYGPLRLIGVGVSAAQLRESGFAGRLLALLNEFAVEADSLVVEVDDGELADLELTDERQLLASLEAVQRAGVSVMLGNVSSAPALFVRLAHLRPDRVKFAASFTSADCLASSRRRGLEAISRAAAQRGFELQAQDVRDGEQAAVLQELGVHLQQGPSVAPPMERSLASRWLRERRDDQPPRDSTRHQAA